MNKNEYEEYLKSEQWQLKRLAAISAAMESCQICKSRKSLQVHHNTYANVGDEDPSDLIVLCDDCHSLFHHKIKQRVEMVPTSAGEILLGRDYYLKNKHRFKGRFLRELLIEKEESEKREK